MFNKLNPNKKIHLLIFLGLIIVTAFNLRGLWHSKTHFEPDILPDFSGIEVTLSDKAVKGLKKALAAGMKDETDPELNQKFTEDCQSSVEKFYMDITETDTFRKAMEKDWENTIYHCAISEWCQLYKGADRWSIKCRWVT